MADSSRDAKFFTPLMPSLLHFASVNIAVQLLHKFGVQLLEDAYAEIRNGNLTASEDGGEESREAKESLLLVPAHLMQGVMEAARGSQRWTTHLAFGFCCVGAERSLQFRSDGSLNALETAENLVRNESLNVVGRFELACCFCLVDSVEALWPEMREAVGSEISRYLPGSIQGFWLLWLRSQPRISWRKCFRAWMDQELTRDERFSSFTLPRCRAIFPLLRPEERPRYLLLLSDSLLDDLLFCVNTFTKDEEEQMIEAIGVGPLLRLYFMWPLQKLFPDTADKLWNCIDVHSFRSLLSNIFDFMDYGRDFNYSELFDGFWEKSPPLLREGAREDPELRERIDSYFEK